jgi:hypothetical protein
MAGEFHVLLFIILAKIICTPINLKHFQVEQYAESAHFLPRYYSFVQSYFLIRDAS